MEDRLTRRATLDGELESVSYRDLFVIVRSGRASVENQRELERRLVELAASYPSGVGVAVLIPASVPPADAPVRREIVALLTRQVSRIRGLVWVIGASGSEAASVRAVATSYSVALRQHYPTFMATDLRGALKWLLPLLGGEARLADLDLTLQAIDGSDEAV
ncbi:MAG: hypothetical protein ABJE95_16665 [Byssovorax sp.]